MTKIYNKETKKFEPITNPEDLPSMTWSEVMSCAGNKEKLHRLQSEADTKKQIILKELKKRKNQTIKEYYIVKEEMSL